MHHEFRSAFNFSEMRRMSFFCRAICGGRLKLGSESRSTQHPQTVSLLALQPCSTCVGQPLLGTRIRNCSRKLTLNAHTHTHVHACCGQTHTHTHKSAQHETKCIHIRQTNLLDILSTAPSPAAALPGAGTVLKASYHIDAVGSHQPQTEGHVTAWPTDFSSDLPSFC